jgi:hypothetical protein
MAEFQFEDSNGQKFVVDAPDLDQAVAAFKQMAGEKAVSDPYANRKGSFLPLSTDASGDLQFDPTTGVLGSILSGVTAPGDVVSGKLDPNSPEGMQRAMDTTGLMMGVNPMVASGERAIPGVAKNLRPGKPEIPSAQALKDAAEAGYKQAGEMGVDYSTVAVKSLADDLQRQLEGEGFREALTPGTFSILKELQAPPADSVMDLLGLTAARKSFGHVAGNFNNRPDQKAATKSIRALDKLLEEPSPESVVAGPAAAAGATIKEANANYAAAMRSGKVTGAAERAELDAAVANSGTNLDNRTRQLLKSILNKPKEARGYSPEELTLMRQVAEGKFGVNLTRWLGNFLGGGGGLGAQGPAALGGAAGAVIGGWPGAAVGAAIPPIIGAALRKTAGAMTQRNVGKLDELIRMRSPLYQKAVENPPMNAVHPTIQDLLSRALLLQATGQESQP